MNYLAGVQRLHRESGRSTAAPTSVVGANERHARLFDWYADAWRNLQGEREWRWMRASLDVALVVGQQTYTATDLAATRFGRWRAEDFDYDVQAYVYGSQNAIWRLSYRQLDNFRQQWIHRTMGSSQPIEWTIDEADQLLLGPAPSEPYQLRIDYWKEPAELALDADEPDMPARFHMMLVWRALQDVAMFDAAPEVLARAEKNYGDLKDALLRDQAWLPVMP